MFCDDFLAVNFLALLRALVFLRYILNVQICSKEHVGVSHYSFQISSAAAPCSEVKRHTWKLTAHKHTG